MTRIRKSYLLSHDIDWIFTCQQTLVHCASNGFLIPDKYVDNNIIYPVQEIVAQLPDLFSTDELDFNEEYLDRFVNVHANIVEGIDSLLPYSLEEIREIHLSSFVAMAKKGLWSFDYPVGSIDNEFILVVKPKGTPNLSQFLNHRHPLKDVDLKDVIQDVSAQISGTRIIF